MEHISPLLQTILWVGLVAGIVWRYHTAIGRLLDGLAKRIESGSTLKAGPFELGSLTPQQPEEQRNRLEAEVQQLTEALNEPAPPPGRRAAVRNRIFQAEDLALRAVQAEFRTVVNRQVRAADTEFDGFFIKEATGYVVEVKYSPRPFSVKRLTEAVDVLSGKIARFGWKNVRIVFVVVYGEEVIDLGSEQARLQSAVDSHPSRVEVKCYSLGELAGRLGVQLDVGG